MGEKRAGRHPEPARAKAAAGGGWLRWLAIGGETFVIGPLIGFVAGLMLFFGGMFLALAWQAGAQPVADAAHYAAFTGKASGHIVESWFALELDPRDIADSRLLNWQPVARVSACAIVAYGEQWDGARRAFCGQRLPFRDSDSWNELLAAAGIPFALAREANGFAVGEIRADETALDWLKKHPPRDTFMLSKPPPATALGELKQQLDDPLQLAIIGWTTAAPEFPLAFDPRHPDEPMLAPLVGDKQQVQWIAWLIFVAVLGVPGFFIWRAGMAFLLGGLPLALQWLLTIAPLLALPWWSVFLPVLLSHLNVDASKLAVALLEDSTRYGEVIASTPDQARLAGGERLTWRAATGDYADTFGRLTFAMPQPAPKSADAVLTALRAQISAQVRTLDANEKAALFVRLRRQFEASWRRVQKVFDSAALDALRDPGSGADVHRVAKDFLISASGATYYEDQLDAMESAARTQ